MMEHDEDALEELKRRRSSSLAVIAACTWYYECFCLKSSKHVSVRTGSMWVNEMMYGNPTLMIEHLRMPLRIFKLMVQQLRKFGQDDSRHVNVEEQLAITLYFLANRPFNRAMQDVFQHSGETITRFDRRLCKKISHSHSAVELGI